MIGRRGERGSGISVLATRHDIYIYIYIYPTLLLQVGCDTKSILSANKRKKRTEIIESITIINF